jgi:hypothetical protein
MGYMEGIIERVQMELEQSVAVLLTGRHDSGSTH